MAYSAPPAASPQRRRHSHRLPSPGAVAKPGRDEEGDGLPPRRARDGDRRGRRAIRGKRDRERERDSRRRRRRHCHCRSPSSEWGSSPDGRRRSRSSEWGSSPDGRRRSRSSEWASSPDGRRRPRRRRDDDSRRRDDRRRTDDDRAERHRSPENRDPMPPLPPPPPLLVAMELLAVLLENPTDDSVEVAVGFVKECGATLQDLSPRRLRVIFERICGILQERNIEKRVQSFIDGLFAIREAEFQEFPAIRPELDLVEEKNQFRHEISLEGDLDPETNLDVFRSNPESSDDEKGSDTAFDDEDEEEEVTNKKIWNKITTEVLCTSCIAMMEHNNIKPNPKFTNDELSSIKEMIYKRLKVSIGIEQIKHKLKNMYRHYKLYMQSKEEKWDAKKWNRVKDRSIEVKKMKEGRKLPNINFLQIMFRYEAKLKKQEDTAKLKKQEDTQDLQKPKEESADLNAISEYQRRESLQTALGVEKQWVADLEKASSEIRAEIAEVNMSGKKIMDAQFLEASLEEKALEIEGKLHAADAKLADANRKKSQADRDLEEVEARQSRLEKEKLCFETKQKAWERQLKEQEESLQDWEKKLKESHNRLVDLQMSINDREERAKKNDQLFKIKHDELEHSRKSVEATKLTLKVKEDYVNKRLNELHSQVSILINEKAILKESEKRAWETEKRTWDEYSVLSEQLQDQLSRALPALPLSSEMASDTMTEQNESPICSLAKEKQATALVSPVNSGINGIPNSTSKYREDQMIICHTTPFSAMVDRAMKKTSA